MLLGDGSPTLRLLTGHSVQVRLVAMAADNTSDAAIGGARPAGGGTGPTAVAPSGLAGLRRHHFGLGRKLVESSRSRTESAQRTAHLAEPHPEPELFQEVDGLALVNEPWLEQGFGEGGPFWSRHYRFLRQGRGRS